MKTKTIDSILLPSEIEAAIGIFVKSELDYTVNPVKRLAVEVIQPALPRINAETGQENDAMYLACSLWNAMRICATVGRKPAPSGERNE
jgi:hypothetical protein